MTVGELSTRERVLRRYGGDEEDSPWMVSTDLHLWAMIALLQGLRQALAAQAGPWYVSGDTFVQYGPAPGDHLAPDLYAAPVADHPRESYSVAEEGVFPPFVLEVLSPSSGPRDLEDKVALYDVLGAEEYVLFDPRGLSMGRPALRAYHRDGQGGWGPWQADADGVLRSAVLRGVGLRGEGHYLRVLTPDGEPVPFAEELEAALAHAEAAQAHSDAARAQTEAALAQAEDALAHETAARQQAERREQAEALLRQQAEQRAAALEAELRRLRGETL